MRRADLLLLVFILLKFALGQAQTGVTMNAANFQDPKLMLANPAAMAFQDSGLFVSGYKRYYLSLGNEHLGNFYSGFSHPWFMPGVLGVTAQYFPGAIFRQLQVDCNYAIPADLHNKRIALGVRVGLFGVSYNPENFHRVDVNDPLLRNGSSKYKFNFGVGGLANPFARLYLGFSADHLNRPDLSLADAKKRLPLNANVSALYILPFFRPQISLEREANETYLNLGLESWLLGDKAILRTGYSAERLNFGAALRFGRWRFDYEYDYLLSELKEVSNGSHQATLSFRFGARKAKTLEIAQVKKSTRRIQPQDSIKVQKVPPAQRDTTTRRESELMIRVAVRSKPEAVTVTVIKKIAEESPLLNYIFFEADSSSIPPVRYALWGSATAAKTSLQYFAALPNIAEQYRNVLNLFGCRLRDNSKLKIILVGCNAGIGTEKGDLGLSRRRAESVKNYLVKVWQIAPERIKADSLRNLPATPSSLGDPRSQDENRRVEILPAPGSEEILDTFASTTVETEISAPACTFFTAGTVAEAGLQSWMIEVQRQDGVTLKTQAGGPMLPDSVLWDWRDEAGSAVNFRDSLRYRLSATDSRGQRNSSPWQTIHVRYVERDTVQEPKVARARLIFFGFDDFRLDLRLPRLQSDLKKIVAKAQQHPRAKVEIKGYTDDLGDSTYNVLLSQRRAQAVKNELVRRGVPASRISATGFGPAQPLMANHQPEGRMMNRRVEVDVIYSE